MSPVTLGSAKEPVVKQLKVPWTFLPPSLRTSARNTLTLSKVIFSHEYFVHYIANLCVTVFQFLYMFIINKWHQLQYKELLLRHVSTIESSHLQGVQVTTEIHSLRMATINSRNISR